MLWRSFSLFPTPYLAPHFGIGFYSAIKVLQHRVFGLPSSERGALFPFMRKDLIDSQQQFSRMAGGARLTKNSKAVRLLRSKFEKGEISGDEQPKAVWDSDSQFQKHKLANFRTCYNAMRLEFGAKTSAGAEIDDTKDAHALDRRCSAGDVTNSGRKQRFAATTNDDFEGSDVEEVEDGSGVELILGDLTFKPLFNISKWTERTTLAKQVCVAIILPSGVGSGDFTINVVDVGQYLQLTVLWPKPLVDVLIMHRWKLSDPQSGFMPYHSSVLGFEASLRELRKRSSDAVESVAIPLPFTVATEPVTKENLSFRDCGGTKMLYVHLKAAVVEEYGVVADTDSFRDV